MSSSVLNTMFGYGVSTAETNRRPETHSQEEEDTRASLKWNSQRFGEEQIRSLVHQVFFQGGTKTPRQVVFSGADQTTDVAEICLQVGQTLSAQISGNVCIVEVASHKTDVHESLDSEAEAPPQSSQRFDDLRESALLLSKNLWLVQTGTFMGSENCLSAAWLRGRIDELRLDFDYTIFQAPPAGQCCDAPLLGHLCDGVVLVLTANTTRRVAARKVKDRLFSANARLLGTVLADRRFPIPEGIYRRL